MVWQFIISILSLGHCRSHVLDQFRSKTWGKIRIGTEEPPLDPQVWYGAWLHQLQRCCPGHRHPNSASEAFAEVLHQSVGRISAMMYRALYKYTNTDCYLLSKFLREVARTKLVLLPQQAGSKWRAILLLWVVIGLFAEEGLGQNKQDAKTKALSDYVQILQPLVPQSCIGDYFMAGHRKFVQVHLTSW